MHHPARSADADLPFLEMLRQRNEFPWREFDEHHVRCAADFAREHGEITERVGQLTRARVVSFEPLDVMVQRVNPGRGEHAGLPHAAAEHLAPAPRMRTNSTDPHSTEPAGAPSPFDKHTDTLSNAAVSVGRGTRCAHRGVEQTRAVEMHRELRRSHNARAAAT